MLYTKKQVEHLLGLTKQFPSLTPEQLIEQIYSLELPEDDEINDAAFDEVGQEHIDAFKQGGEWVLGVIRSRAKRIANTYTDDNDVEEQSNVKVKIETFNQLEQNQIQQWLKNIIQARFEKNLNHDNADEPYIIEPQRYEEIKQETERRVRLWVQNSSFDEMTVGGSKLRFTISIAGLGYPFEKEAWMGSEEFNAFITEEEFDSPQYDEIVDELFDKYYNL